MKLSLATFEKSMQNLLENSRNKNFLLAASGGVDSMALASLFKICNLNFEVAHINYKLRGKDSDDDANLVSDFCKKHHIRLHLYEVSEKDQKPEGSIQLWARNLRYGFFRKIQKAENLEYLVTAHHLNDQLETFLINLSRGSGIKGLSGIPAKENNILRPLLSFSKDEIYRFASENKIDFREDLSNQKSNYLRNKIRNEIVPKLLETNTSFLENFSKSLNLISQTKNFVEKETDKRLFELQVFSNENILDKKKISEESSLIQFEIFNRFGFDEKQIDKILNSGTGSVFSAHDFKLTVNRNELIFEPISERIAVDLKEIELKTNSKNQVVIPKKIKNEIEKTGKIYWKFDLDQLHFPLMLRHKEEGDFFFPVGMVGKKKVSKFFKDEKISILAKPKIWLLCDGNNDVLGILPYRQDRRFAAAADTKNILEVII